MSQLIQALVLGLLIGGVYALMAFLIMVAMFTWWLWKETGIDPILASVVTTPLMFCFGWLVYRYLLSRIRDQSPSMSVLLTFGFALVIEGALNVVAGNKFKSATPSYFEESSASSRRPSCWPCSSSS